MAQEETVKILKVETGDSEQTVKSLRDEIKSLRDNILNLQEGTEDYDKAVDKLQDDQRKLDKVMSLTKKTATALDGSYDALTQKMSQLKSEWRKTNDEAKRNELGKQINDINDQLKEMDATTGNFQRNVGNYTESIVDAFDKINQEIGELQNKAALAWQTGDMKAYGAAIEEIGKKQGVLDQINRDSEFMNGSTEKRMQALTGVAEGVAGGFAALQGVIALAGGESEDFEKTMVKLSSAMAIVQGFQGVEGFVGGLKGLKVALKTSIGGLSAFKKALIGTGIGAFVVVLGTLVANWKDFTGWVEKSIGSLDKFKTVFAGVKGAIGGFFENIFKGFGEVLKGNFNQASEYMKKAVQFSANYETAAAEKTVQIAQDTAREKAKIAHTETEDYIKDQEAKKGADWKWSDEGIRAYKQMFTDRLSMYKKDTEEYKEAQREKWEFDRELKEKLEERKPKDVNEIVNHITTEVEDTSIEDEPLPEGWDAKIKLDDDEIELKKKSFEIKKELNRQEVEIEKRTAEEIKKSQQEKIEVFQASAQAISGILSGVAQSYQADLDAQLATGKISEEAYNQKFKKIKQLQIAEATINTISGALGAFMGITKDTGGWGIALATIKAATIAATGFAQIAQIKKTTPGVSAIQSGMVQPPATLFQDAEPKAVKNITGLKETEELNRTQRVILVESDMIEAMKRVEIRQEETSF